MARRKTNEEFVKEVYDLVGDEYRVLEEYTNSKTKIKFKHEICGRTFTMWPGNFLHHNQRCPICMRKQSDINRRKTHQEFINEVKKQYGNQYEILSQYTTAKDWVYIRHNVCGHEWNTKPDTLLNSKCGCPLCYGNHKKTTHHFKQEVLDLVGSEYLVLNDYTNAKTKITIKHSDCGHVYSVEPRAFLSGARCPSCMIIKAGVNRRLTHTEFLQRMQQKYSGEYTTLTQYIKYQDPIIAIHNKCGHKWTTTPSDLLSGYGCPMCAISKGESVIALYLNQNSINYTIEYIFNDCRNIAPLPFDFFLPTYNLLIEYDGQQHFEPVDFAGRGRKWATQQLKQTQKRDQIKNQYCKDNNIPLLRIPYWEFDNIETILEEWLTEHGVLNQ